MTKTKSKLGITSFILSLMPLFGCIVLIIISAIMQESQGPPDDFTNTIVGGIACSFFLLSIISILLGIVGLTKKEPKLYNILGIVISSGYFFLLLILGLIGMAL